MTDDHEAHEHCGCCGRCYAYLLSSFCLQCRSKGGHLGGINVNPNPWDRTYEAVHGAPCPFADP